MWRGRHVAEPTELTDREAAAYGREVLLVGRALEAVLQPVKLNYDVLGNTVPHLHTHIVPRYADDPRPGWPYPFPDPAPRTDAAGSPHRRRRGTAAGRGQAATMTAACFAAVAGPQPGEPPSASSDQVVQPDTRA